MSIRLIVGAQYFIFFAITGIYLPYFNLYCYHLNFSGFQIGILSAIRSMTLIFFPVLWSILADRHQIRKPIFIFCNFASAMTWALYLLTADFRLMTVITLFFGIFSAPVISFLEAFTMDILAQEKQSYGRLRVWGSISFILSVIIFGRMIDYFSIQIILTAILGGLVLRIVAALQLPNIRPAGKKPFLGGLKLLLNRQVVLFLGCAFLMLVSHGTYYGFFSIHLEMLGYGKTFIGICWAMAIIFEILVMINSDRIYRRFSTESILFFSFMATTLRWFVLFFFKSPAMIVMSQIFHAFSYGTFHIASILYIDRLAPDEVKTVAQAINNALSYGLGLTVAFFLNGYLYERLGSFMLFGISALIALAGGTVFKLSQRTGA